MADEIEQNKGAQLLVILLLGALAYLLGTSFFAFSYSFDSNYRNVTVDTRVNITGSPPVIIAIPLPVSITLNAGILTTVDCNVSIRDYNGFNDVDTVNATFFHSTSSEFAADNNNTHYTNTSCVNITGQQSGFYTNYSCKFTVNYYALNGTWNCSARVNDTKNLKGSSTNSTIINALYALNITPTVIDYGNVSSGDSSNNITMNVTNFGNLNINISVYGYGVNIGDNLSFNCTQGNLSVDLQHFAANSTANWTQKQNLSGVAKNISLLTINKTTNITPSLNTTWWELYVDPAQAAFGNCTGFVVFQANTAVP